MGLFSKDDDMKKVGEDMQNLSNQIADLQKKLAGKTAEADSLRTQAAQASGSSVALEDAQSEIAVLRQQIADMKAQAEAATAPVAKVLSDISSSSAATEGAKAIGGLTAGAQAWVTRAGGLPLRMRSAPSLSGEVLDRLAPGTELTLLDGPQQADGHGWWHVRTAGGEGWVAGEELRTQPD